MPPQLALLLVALFVPVLLRLSRYSQPTVSQWLWIPTIWIAIMGSRMLSQWFTSSPDRGIDAYTDGSPIDRNIFLFLIVAAAIAVFQRRSRLAGLISRNAALCMFLVYCGISIAWSDFPTVSIKRYVKDLGDVLMVLVILTEASPVEAISSVVKRCAYTLIPMSIVLYKYYPGIGRVYDRWNGKVIVTGVTSNKNELGVLALICGLLLIWSLLLVRRGRLVPANPKVASFVIASVLVMTIWTLITANSATSIACFALGTTVLMLAPSAAGRLKWLGVFSLLILAAALAVDISSAGLLDTFTSALGRDATLTGRTDLWADLLTLAGNPLIGVGFGSFWLGDRLSELWSKYWWQPTEAHNGYLEVYLELGLLGCALLGCVIVSLARRCATTLMSDPDIGRLRLALLVVALVYNITEAAFRVDLLMYLAFLLVAVDVYAPDRAPVAIRDRSQLRVPPGGPYLGIGKSARPIWVNESRKLTLR